MLVQSREQFDAVMDCLKVTELVAVDTETNGLNVHKGHRLCGISVHMALQEPYTLSAYFPFRHAIGTNLFDMSDNLPIEWLRHLGVVLGRRDLFTLWHGFKFDAGMFRADDLEIQGDFFCTLIGASLIDENMDHKLGALERRYLGTDTKEQFKDKDLKPYLKGKKDYSKVPPAAMERYAGNDTRLTYDLAPMLQAELEAQEMMGLWSGPHGDMKFVRTLFGMEWSGILIDRPLAERLSSETEGRMRTLEDEMGFDPQKRAVLASKLFATQPEGLGLQPPTRVTSDVSPLFPAGLPVMDEAVLRTYNDPLIARVLEYRKCVKLNSTFYAGYLRASDPNDRIHPIYNTAGDFDAYGARTGRLTCSSPNIQQQPRNPAAAVRKLCIPPWRHRLVEFDYNQIEYRLAGVYADEAAIIDAYRAGSDMHQLTADKLGIPRVDPMGGVDGKKINFTILYGGGPQRIADTFGGSLDQGKAIFNDFWANYPKLRQLVRNCEKAAKDRGWIKLWDGHRRHFHHEWEYHKAFNSLIQGGAARIVQRSMLMVASEPRCYEMKAQIHDALQFYITLDFFEEYVQEIKDIMEWPGERFDLAFPVEWKNIHEGTDRPCPPEYAIGASTQEEQLAGRSS